MIKSIELYKLRNGEYIQYMQDVLVICRQYDPVNMQVRKEFNALLDVAGGIEAVFKVPTGSPVTGKLQKFDALREEAIRGIATLVRGYMFSDNPVVKNHAITLSNHLALFGNIAEHNYQNQTNSIRNIIEDCNSIPELINAVTELGLQNWLTALENANNSFNEKYLLRAVELGNNTTEAIKIKRLQANEHYYALRNKINAYCITTDGAEPYTTVAASVNGLIAYYNELLARRVGGSDKKR